MKFSFANPLSASLSWQSGCSHARPVLNGRGCTRAFSAARCRRKCLGFAETPSLLANPAENSRKARPVREKFRLRSRFVSRRKTQNSPIAKKFTANISENLKKPLYKRKIMCYNMACVRAEDMRHIIHPVHGLRILLVSRSTVSLCCERGKYFKRGVKNAEKRRKNCGYRS